MRHLFVIAWISVIVSACGQPRDSAHQSDASANIASAEAFVDAFYSFDPRKLQASLASAHDSRPAILFYQGWAEGANYGIVTRRSCVSGVGSISCSITVKDDLIRALGIDFNVTDTFTLRFSNGNIVAVETGSDDPMEYHDAQKWVQKHRPELIEIPCQGFFAGGPTPGACAKAMVAGYSEFAAGALPSTAQ